MARKLREDRRLEILETALRVIGERGVARTRLQDIAEAMDVSSALVSYHFDSIASLFQEAYALAIARDLEFLDEFEIRADGLSATERLRLILNRYLPEGQVVTYRLWIEAWVIALQDESMSTTLEMQDRRWRSAIQQVIAEGVASEEFTSTDAAASMWRLKMLVDGYSVQSTVGIQAAEPPEIHHWIETAVCTELGLTSFSLNR